MDEINILKPKIGSISLLDVVNHPATITEGCFEVSLDAKQQSTSNNDPSIFDDAYDDNERQISGLSYYSALSLLSSSAFTENERSMTNNTYSRDINFGNDDPKGGFARIITPDDTWVADKCHSGLAMTQSSDLMPLTKQTSKAFAQQIAGNPVSKRRPFSANDTLKSLADVASSSSFMPKTEKGKAQLVISNPLIYDTSFSKNLHDVTFVGDNEISDADILSGRGGKSNHHVGNKRFRHLVSEMKSRYRSAAQIRTRQLSREVLLRMSKAMEVVS